MIYYIILCAIIGYLIGSIPFGYIIVRMVKGLDIRTLGSGNIGATNVGRVAGFWYGVLCFILDLNKGFLGALSPFIFSVQLYGKEWLGINTDIQSVLEPSFIVSGFFAIIGHFFPLYIGFKGGKGVATAMGVFILLAPSPLLIAVIIWLAVLILSRYVSLASIAASFGLAAASFVIDEYYFLHTEKGLQSSSPIIIFICCIMGALVILRHKQNIKRLINGTEPKVKLWKREPRMDTNEHKV